jgi:hypothetical protein
MYGQRPLKGIANTLNTNLVMPFAKTNTGSRVNSTKYTHTEWTDAMCLLIKQLLKVLTRGGKKHFHHAQFTFVSRNSSVGSVTRYGSKPRPDRPWGLLYLPLSGGKAAGVWCRPLNPSNAEVTEREGIYVYSPSGPTWHVIGWNLPLSLPLPVYIPHYSNSDIIYPHHN